MAPFLITSACAVALLAATLFVNYEILRWTWNRLPGMTMHPHSRALMVVGAIFVSHCIGIWLYAGMYHALESLPSIGMLFTAPGVPIHDTPLLTALYFSAATYSSLGFGDVVPTGYLRLLAGSEALVGLCMIGWSASFIYLVMKEFWTLPHRPGGHRHRNTPRE